jgi:hypothetical protein
MPAAAAAQQQQQQIAAPPPAQKTTSKKKANRRGQDTSFPQPTQDPTPLAELPVRIHSTSAELYGL